MNRFVSGLAWRIALTAVLACSSALEPDDFYGVWTADGVRLTLSETRALFESPCWRGELPIPIRVDGDRFEAVGTVTSQGGPGMDTRFATFSGRISGNVLSLEVSPASLGLGPYELVLDAPVQIPGCPQPATPIANATRVKLHRAPVA